MIRILKQVAQQSGTWTPSNNLVDFKNSCEKDAVIDMNKSYIIANVQPVNWVDDPVSVNADTTDQVHLFKFGSPERTRYPPSCMVMNSSLSSYRDGELEYNRDRNFYQQNMLMFENDNDMLDGLSRIGYANDKNLITGQTAYPFVNVKKTGTTSSNVQASDVIIPMSDILQLGNKKIPYTWGELTTHLELDNKNVLFNEDDPLDGNSSLKYWGLLPSGAINDINPVVNRDKFVLTTQFADADALRTANYLGVGSIIYIMADINDTTTKIVQTSISVVDVTAAPVITIETVNNVWDAGDVVTNAALLTFTVDFINNGLANRAAGGANLNQIVTTFDFTSVPNFTAQTGITLNSYVVVRCTKAGGPVAGEYMQVFRVTALAYAGAAITLTLDRNVWDGADTSTHGYLQILAPNGTSLSAVAKDRAADGASLANIALSHNFTSVANFSTTTAIVIGSTVNFKAEVKDGGVTTLRDANYVVNNIVFNVDTITLTMTANVWTATQSSKNGVVTVVPANSGLDNRVLGGANLDQIVFTHDFGSAAAFSLVTGITDGAIIRVVVDKIDNGVTTHIDDNYIVNVTPAYAANKITLTLDRNIWDNTSTSLNGSAYSKSLNDTNDFQLQPMFNTNTGVTVESFSRIEDSPYYVGQVVNIQGANQLMQEVDIYRKITAIAWTGTPPTTGVNTASLTLTFNGTPIYLFGGCMGSLGALATTPPEYQVNRMEIVLWKVNYGASFKKMMGDAVAFNKLLVEPLNRDTATSFEKKFQLPAGTMKYIFLNKVSDLRSRDANLDKYRLYADNFPTTDRDVQIKKPLYDDRIIRYFGGDLRKYGDPVIVPEVNLNWATSPSPMVELRETAKTGKNLDQSIIYLYSLVNSEIKI